MLDAMCTPVLLADTFFPYSMHTQTSNNNNNNIEVIPISLFLIHSQSTPLE